MRLALANGLSVVVDNTHTRRWEMQPYFDMADAFGLTPEIIIARGTFQNLHGVPADVVESMRARFED